MYKAAATLHDDDYLFLPAGDQYGEGWWSDRWDDVKSVAKKIQSSSAVRNLEKGAVNVAGKALRSVVEPAVDGIADTALTAVGAPELAPFADKMIDKGASYLQKKGTQYLDQKIDASGSGRVRYMSPSGGGLRLAGTNTHLGSGLRLAGSGMRLAGSGMRLAGAGHRVQPLVEGRGHCLSCSA
eukprot:COSAG01_NODE_2120_length_8375_cov_364.611890_2_plen_183_part_00